MNMIQTLIVLENGQQINEDLQPIHVSKRYTVVENFFLLFSFSGLQFYASTTLLDFIMINHA